MVHKRLTPTVSVYQNGVDGHWTIDEISSTADRVTGRWRGSGTHAGEINGTPPMNRPLIVDAPDRWMAGVANDVT